MKIFVTGGTGYIGEVLVKEGMKLGHEMIVMTRSKEKAAQLKQEGAYAVVGDLLVDGDWLYALNEADAVIHLAAPPTWGKKVTKKVALAYADGHLSLTKRLFEVVNPEKVKKIIFVGGTSYYGDSGNGEEKDETFRSEPKGWGPYIAPSIEYARTKSSEFPVSIVFPAQIYGPSSWMEQLFLEPLYSGKAITSLKGYTPHFSPIHIEDCGRAFIHLIDNGVNGEDYILTDTERVDTTTYRQEIERIMNVKDVKVRLVPRFLCQLLIGPVLTEYATAHTNFTSKKLLDTGFEFRYPTYKDGLPNVVEQWLAKK